MREAVRIRRRGGAGEILNSKAEFNRCHITRLVVEEEDDESRIQREENERLEDEELGRTLEDMDLTWEQRKDRQRILAERKRGRNKDVEDENLEDGVARKKRRRMVYTKLEDNWGEDEEGPEDSGGEQLTVIVPAALKPSTKGTIPSVITDYFSVVRPPKDSERMMSSTIEDTTPWPAETMEDEAWFDEFSQTCAEQTWYEDEQ